MENADAANAQAMQDRALHQNRVQNRVEAENLADRNVHRCVFYSKTSAFDTFILEYVRTSVYM